MLGSMYSAVSGLSAHQMKMNVIGNNIANVNTYGFKSSRVTFSDVFYQTIKGSASATTNTGGVNPAQLGYGAKVSSIDVINTRAGSATTDRPLDVYINGEGYLPVKDSTGIIKYTRVGVLGFDASGNLVDTSGNMVLGIPSNSVTGMPQLGEDGMLGASGLVPINVSPADLDKFTGIVIGANGEITAIKQGDPVVVPAPNTNWLTKTEIQPTSIYHGKISMSATKSAGVSFLPSVYPGETTPIFAGAAPVPTNADVNGPLKLSLTGSDYKLTYTKKDGTTKTANGTVNTVPTPNTVTFDVDAVGTGTVAVTIPVGGTIVNSVVFPPGVPELTIGNAVASNIQVTVSTYDKGGSAVSTTAEWYAIPSGTQPDNKTIKLGDMTFTVDPAKFGAVPASVNTFIGSVGPGPGLPIKIANLAIVKFTNADGLSQSGEGYYLETTNSGKPVGTMPGNEGTGTLRSGALEMSNVDLSREFTEMIIAQRGFQANTRMITVSDEMLSELVNMKR